jgi:hypothetical protein
MSTQPAKARDLIFDVGLHRGEDTEFYLKKGFRVVAFVADGELVDYCREKFAAAMAAGRLVIVEGAIVDVPEGAPPPTTVLFYKSLGRSIWGARRFPERIHWNRRVLDVENVEVFRLLRCPEEDAVAWARLHQGARER